MSSFGTGTSWTIIDESESDLEGRSSSSTLSWSDETDSNIAQELKEQYEKFEAALYRENGEEGLTPSEIKEKDNWAEQFVHLRITGHKVKPSIGPSPDSYPEDYEEIFEFSPAKTKTRSPSPKVEKCREDLRKAVVDKLFERVWPTVLKKIGPYLSPKRGQRVCTKELERHDHTNRMTQKDLFLKPKFEPNLNDIGRRKTRYVPSSARQRKKSATIEYEESSNESTNLQNLSQGSRHGLLPPIETIAITPTLPNKRANSAMVRFNRSQSRARPNTSKNKTLFLIPLGTSTESSENRINLSHNSNETTSSYRYSLPPCSAKKGNKRISPRWRY